MRFFSIFLLTAVLVAGGLLGAGGASAAIGQVTYTGTATVTVDFYDYCGANASLAFVRTQQYSYPTTLVVADPPNGDSNPISISLASDQQGGDGQFGVTSVLPTAGLTLGYWSLAYNSDTGAISGTLTNTHEAEAAATNLLFSTTPLIPCRDLGSIPNAFSMAEGSTLSGTISTGGAALTVTGRSSDALRAFRVDVSLTPA
jgi:hypothetical protein